MNPNRMASGKPGAVQSRLQAVPLGSLPTQSRSGSRSAHVEWDRRHRRVRDRHHAVLGPLRQSPPEPPVSTESAIGLLFHAD